MDAPNAHLKQLPPTTSGELVSAVDSLTVSVKSLQWMALWTAYEKTKLQASLHAPPMDLAEHLNEKAIFDSVNDFRYLRPSRDHKTSLNHLRDGRWKLQPSDILLSLSTRALASSRILENLVVMSCKLPSLDFNQAVTSIKAANHRRTGNKHDDLSSLQPKDVSLATEDMLSSGSRVNAHGDGDSHESRDKHGDIHESRDQDGDSHEPGDKDHKSDYSRDHVDEAAYDTGPPADLDDNQTFDSGMC